MSTSLSLSSSSELSDYDSSSSMEIVVSPKKLKEELNKELEAERKAAAAKGEQTYNDGTAIQIDDDGRVRSAKVVRLERIKRARQLVKAKVMKNVAQHLQKAYVRKTLLRGMPPKNDLWADEYKRKVFINADENQLCVKVVNLPCSPVFR